MISQGFNRTKVCIFLFPTTYKWPKELKWHSREHNRIFCDLFGVKITSQTSWYLPETQLTQLSFRLRTLLLSHHRFNVFLLFRRWLSHCRKWSLLLENQITTPKPYHAKILNYWDFLRSRKPPFFLFGILVPRLWVPTVHSWPKLQLWDDHLAQ